MNVFQKIFHLFQYGRPNRPITRASLDEEVFAYRERRYGSYELRKNQPWYLLTATGIVMSAMMCAVFVPIRMGWVQQDDSLEERIPLPRIISCSLTPPPPPPIHCGNYHFVDYRIPKPVAAAEVSVVEAEEEWMLSEPEESVDPSLPDIDDFLISEKEPRSLNMTEVVKNIGYPQIARDAGIQGSVVVRVLIDHEGNYLRHQVINREHPILSREVEKHVSELRFEPAIQGGKPIAFWVNVPFVFKGV